jgi:protein PhnA
MAGNDDYVFDEETGEWMPASELAARQAASAQADRVVVRDCEGNVLSDGDQVIVTKDLPVKGTGQVIKRGTVIRSIRLTGDAQDIDCRHETIKGLVLRAEFVRKRQG